MAYASSPFTDVCSGQPSTPYVQWPDAPQCLSDPRHRLGPSVPLPTAAEWHTSDASSPSSSWLSAQYPSSPDSSSSSATSPPSSRASSPGSSSFASPRPNKKSVSRRSAKDPSHIPRPRNAFILFRSAKCQELRESNVETDHRMISRIIGDLWKTADAATKKKYQDMAAQEKEEHSRLYPGYRFNPQARIVPPKRRNVKRNGDTDRQRCKLIAELLHKGNNTRLKEEVEQFDQKVKQEMSRRAAYEVDGFTTNVFDSSTWVPPPTPPLSSPSSASTCSETPFRSPLLPPVSSPPTPESYDVDAQEQTDPLSPLQLDPKHPFDGQTSNPTSLPSPEMVNTVYSQPAGFPLPAAGFGAMHPQEQGILGISNMYPPRVPQFDAPTPTNHLHFQDQALFSVDLSFHEPTPFNLDAGAQIPEANLQMSSYHSGFQSAPQPLPQPHGHPHAQYLDHFAYDQSYSGNFGVQTPYDAAGHGVYPMWPSGQADVLQSSVQAEPAHLGGYF